MRVYTMDGQVHDFPDSRRYLVSDTTLTITDGVRYPGIPRTLAVFPLVNIQRWEP